MDSHPSAPQPSSDVSNQSGSLPPSFSLQNSAFDGGNNDSVNVIVVNGGDDGSDSEGFLSGEEEFETAPVRAIVSYPDGKSIEGDVVVEDPSVNSVDYFTERPIAKVTEDDGDNNETVGSDSEVEVLGGTKVVQGGDSDLGLSGEGSKDNLGSKLEDKEDLEHEEMKDGESHKEVVEASGGGDADGDDKIKGSEAGKVDAGEENGVKSHHSKDEGFVIEENNELSYNREHSILKEADNGGNEVSTGGNSNALSGETNDSDSLIAQSAFSDGHGNDKVSESESGKVDGVAAEESGEKLLDLKNEELVTDGGGGYDVGTGGAGDSVVDALQVDLLASGVAVVGDKEQVDHSEIRGLEGSASSVSLNNEFVPIEPEEAEEAFDKLANGDAKKERNVETGSDDDSGDAEKGQKHEITAHTLKDVHDDIKTEAHADDEENKSHVEASGENVTSEDVNSNSSWRIAVNPDEDDEEEHHPIDIEIDGSVSDGDGEEMVFGSSEAARQFLEELEQQSGVGSHSGFSSSQDVSKTIDGQIVTDSEEEVDTDDEGNDKELFDSSALAALLKAATGAGQDGGGSITISSQDGSRLFSVERPAGLGASLQSGKTATGSNRANLFSHNISRASTNSDVNLTEEEKKKLENLQQIRVKFLRLVHRLGFTPEESIAAQVLYRLTLVTGRQTGEIFSLDAAKETARQHEAEGRDDLNFSLNILVLGKSGVGKSATVNSIFGETKTTIGAYGPATTAVTEIVGMVDGVKIKIFDTPGLKSSALEQSFNRKILSTVKKLTKKSPPDIVLYVDRLDSQTRDLNDLPLLRSISNALGPSIWRNAIVTLTHAASAPPDGPSGAPLSYDVFVAQRSHIVQQSIGQAVGDLRLMNPSLMNPVSLVENHPSCRRNRDGQKVLPNGQNWRSLLMLLCYSMKILSEASNLSKAQEAFDHRKMFGFRVRSPPLPYFLSWLLQSRTHPKLPADQGGIDNGDSDVELADLSDSDLDEDEDEYDQLLPFKPLKKSQVAKLSKEQQKAYFEEYDYRVKLQQKKQWREELRRMREMKKKGKTNVSDYGSMEEDDQENGSPAAVPVPLPDMVLPPSFDSDNPAYRYRFLEPTSQLLTRPVLDTHSWDHDCGYDGVNLEQSLAIINQFPAAVAIQITKDKKDFSIHLDSSVTAKHGENGSTMAGFDIQNVGKQLAYIVRGDTKFKNFKRNKTAAGVSLTFLGENVSTGLKIEDQIALGKRLVLVGSAGTVRSQGDSAYGTNLEVRLREADFPIGQDQYTLGLSLVKWRGDLALGANFQSQFSLGRSYKMAIRAGLNNKNSGQISVRTSSSDQIQIALIAILPIARAIYNNFWPKAQGSDDYSIY